MEYRRLGRSELEVSVVGFGTNELRLVPEKRAIDTLLRGFELGVNIVHTSPDYEGAEALVAQALARTDRKIIVASQGYDVHYNPDGQVVHFERLFEETCARLRTDRLDLYGIAAVDDREAFQENVWGKDGMVEFLLRMKERGRIGAVYCTNHGEPAHIRKLIESDVFDAVMISYNPLGYHLLSLHPPPSRHFEDVRRNGSEILPLCRERDIGVIAMMPLAGGLLVDSVAFPPRTARESPSRLTATDVLRAILEDPAVSCVMPGTASLAEAEENAKAGHAPLVLSTQGRAALHDHIHALQTSVCSRCGKCEELCSQDLPISWLFRAGEMGRQPAEAFETWSDVEYFRLHPASEATCSSCANVTCACPAGIDIPNSLTTLHATMRGLLERRLVSPPLDDARARRGDDTFGARVLVADIPTNMVAAETYVCRLHLENTGIRGWFPDGRWENGGVLLAVYVNGARVTDAKLRHDVHSGGRGHFVFEVKAPLGTSFHLRLQMLGEYQNFAESAGFEVLAGTVPLVRPSPSGRFNRLAGWWRRRTAGQSAAAQAKAPTEAPTNTAGSADTGLHYDIGWIEHNLPEAWTSGEPYHVYLLAENRGSRPWAAVHPDGHAVNLVLRVDGAVQTMLPLPHDVGRGERVTFTLWLELAGDPSSWDIAFSFVEQNVAWFEDAGAQPLSVTIRNVSEATSVAKGAAALMRRANPASYLPSGGMPRSRSGRPYPLVMKEAVGARIRDPDGNEWVDYVMGWGSTLLGYAHSEITRAVSDTLHSGAITSLPHILEAEVTSLLEELIPCAEMAVFGKNGSDVCTAAVRAARLHTGRRVVLFSGYHGWQDPFAEVFEPALAKPGRPAEAFRFDSHGLEGFRSLVREHAGQIAAVMVEPAAQVGGVDGPVHDADPGLLQQVAETCRSEGAVLIFDEIMTGFRYAEGSVQQATGIVPDLACFGKALTSGMPLSALVGRREVLANTLSRLFYHPTFKGETYSFAAAAAALKLYKREDVPGRIHAFGTRLQATVNQVCEELGVDGRLIGLPYRMVFRFDEPNERLRTYKRTLLQQELLQHGILTFRGFMLPSLAHDEPELSQTVDAFRLALARVQEAAEAGSFVSRLEIPLVV